MTARFLSACALIFAASLAATPAHALSVHFYPSHQVWAYEADAAHGASTLMLQNIAVVNDGADSVQIDHVTIELLSGDRAIDMRTLDAASLQRSAAGGAGMQQQGLLELLAFQFGGDALLGKGTKLAPSAKLAPGQALMLNSNIFAFRGARDAVRVRVNDGAAEGRLAIRTGVSKTAFRFPLDGTWWLANGAGLHTGHRWSPMEEFAYDLGQLAPDFSTHRGAGTAFADYVAYGATVMAAADGRVVSVVTDQVEDAHAMQQPGESTDTYMQRLQQDQFARIAKGAAAIGGNSVVIDHGNGEYSFYAHLKPGSVKVKVGDVVKAGQAIGALGSSGNSTEPHLHFQVTDGPDPLLSAGIPIRWQDLEVVTPDPQRAPQSGDLVRARR
jgi:murein DD-endopeptidase MepM/ murein hydrolase activator NlpD